MPLQAPSLSSDGGGDKTRCLRGEFWCLPRVEMLVAGPELAGGQADRPLPLAGSKSQACLPLGPKEQGEGVERGLVFRAEEIHQRTGKGEDAAGTEGSASLEAP